MSEEDTTIYMPWFNSFNFCIVYYSIRHGVRKVKVREFPDGKVETMRNVLIENALFPFLFYFIYNNIFRNKITK